MVTGTRGARLVAGQRRPLTAGPRDSRLHIAAIRADHSQPRGAERGTHIAVGAIRKRQLDRIGQQ